MNETVFIILWLASSFFVLVFGAWLDNRPARVMDKRVAEANAKRGVK